MIGPVFIPGKSSPSQKILTDNRDNDFDTDNFDCLTATKDIPTIGKEWKRSKSYNATNLSLILNIDDFALIANPSTT